MMDDYKAAIADLDSLIRIRDNDAGLFYARGYWHEYTDDLQSAASDYKRCLALDQRYYEAYFGLAFVYKQLGNIDLACETLKQAVEEGSQISEDLRRTYCR